MKTDQQAPRNKGAKAALLACMLAACMAPRAGIAAPIDTAAVTDDFYGSYNGAIDSNATGSAAQISWQSAIYGLQFDLFFTNANGVIIDLLTNDPSQGGAVPGDLLTLYGAASGNGFIGENCASVSVSVANACVAATGQAQDITYFFNMYGSGICCGGSDIMLAIGDNIASVPEPASLPVVAVSLLGLGLVRRRVRFPAGGVKA